MPDYPHRARVGAVLLVILLGVVACGPRSTREGKATPQAGGETISAFQPVATILESSCATSACHSASRGAGQLVLAPDVARSNLVDVPSNQQESAILVVPGDPEASYLMAKLRGDEGIRGSRMPIGQAPLSEEEMATVSGWIADGAGE